MRLGVGQLRRLISEIVAEAPKSVKAPKIVLGGVYYSPRGQEIIVQFIEGDHVAYDFLSNGKRKGVDDARMSNLKNLMIQYGFKLDHVETW